jgi:tryptophan 2,3-dioxygenase
VTNESSADSVVGCPSGTPDGSESERNAESTVASFGGETLTSHHFGEEGAKLTYGSYLRLDQLLSAQVLESVPPAHDELLFITIHQVYELWFKQLLHEVDAATAAMFDGKVWWAKHLLKRVAVIEDVLVRQIAVLETMTPQDFLVFRELLSPASGFQSAQFRELEFASGAKDPSYLQRFRGLTAEEAGRLERRLEAPSLWDGFVHVVAAAGLPAANEDELRDSLVKVAGDRGNFGEVWELAEALLDHDEQAAAWRARHVTMVERQIGTKSGTGGSTGAPYLRSRLGLHYYPLLWELRSHL